MIGRLRDGWSDHALGHDARRAFQPRGRIRQVFLAIGAVKFRHVLGVGVHNQQMSGHGTFLSDWMLSNKSHIGSAAALMGYAIPAEQLIAIERQVAASIFEVDDLDALYEMRDRARALEQYLRDKELQGPMLGAQRRLEARIGQLLGKAEPTNQSAVSREIRRIERRNDRLDFRILAHALNGDCQLQDAEWRKSRRALISLIR